VKRPFRGGSAREPADGVQSGGALDEEVWRRLAAIVAAGNQGDADELSGLWQTLEREVSDDQRGLAGVYVWYLVQYQVIDVLGRKPTVEDLHELAVSIHPKFSKLIRWDIERLEDMLCTIFELAPPGRQVTGGQLVVSASAVVSVLVDDPISQLAIIRPPLARWSARNAGTLRKLGPMAPPRSAP
jgi:hypothetical protein